MSTNPIYDQERQPVMADPLPEQTPALYEVNAAAAASTGEFFDQTAADHPLAQAIRSDFAPAPAKPEFTPLSDYHAQRVIAKFGAEDKPTQRQLDEAGAHTPGKIFDQTDSENLLAVAMQEDFKDEPQTEAAAEPATVTEEEFKPKSRVEAEKVILGFAPSKEERKPTLRQAEADAAAAAEKKSTFRRRRIVAGMATVAVTAGLAMGITFKGEAAYNMVSNGLGADTAAMTVQDEKRDAQIQAEMQRKNPLLSRLLGRHTSDK